MVIKATLPWNLTSLLGKHPAFKRLLNTRALTPSGTAAEPSGEVTSTSSLALPDNLRDKVLIQDTGSHLLLLVPNNAVAQILRFHLPKLKSQWGNRDVSIRIQPNLSTATNLPASNQRQIDQHTAELLKAVADDCDHDPLADALRRIAALAKD